MGVDWNWFGSSRFMSLWSNNLDSDTCNDTNTKRRETMTEIPMGLDYEALKRQATDNEARSAEISAEREKIRKKKKLLSASTIWNPCEMYPYLEASKGNEGMRPRHVITQARLQAGRELEPVIEQKLIRMYGGDLRVMRRADSGLGTFFTDEEHGLCGTMDRRFKFGNEILAGELKTIGAGGATLWEKQQQHEDLFDYFCNPGAAAPWWQSWAGQVLLYAWFLHQRNPKVHRTLMGVMWKDNLWTWPIWVDMREYDYLLDDILKRVKYLRKALSGDKDVTVRRTSNWMLCQVCPRLFQCQPDRIAGITTTIEDDAAFLLAKMKLKVQQAHKDYGNAHKQLTDMLKARFREFEPMHTDQKFNQEYLLIHSSGERLALQAKCYHKKGFTIGEHWEWRFTVLPVEVEE